MRTLQDNKKIKNQNKKATNATLKQPAHIKKTVKTSFYEPYTYNIELLSYEDSIQAKNIIIRCIDQLRKTQVIDSDKIFESTIKNKVIEFKPKVKEVKALRSKNCIVGINSICRKIEHNQNPTIVIIYFDPKKYEMLQKLITNIIMKGIKYLILKSNEEQVQINRKLGIKIVNVIAFYQNESIENEMDLLIKLSYKCIAEIPHLFQHSLYTAKVEQVTTIKQIKIEIPKNKQEK